MSVLIDNLLHETVKDDSLTQGKDARWYIAKPMPFFSKKTKLEAIKDAVRVIMGKSFAVHYKQDEK